MPKRDTLALFAAALALFATPAHADGYADKPVQRGPEPLRAHVPAQPAPDCELIGGNEWYCPPAEPATRRYVDESQTRRYTRRYTTGGKCCGTPVQTISAPAGLTLDTTGFGGGVGAGVTGGYYGGGGRVIVMARASSSARAYASAAASMRYSGSFNSWGGGYQGGGCNVCGR